MNRLSYLTDYKLDSGRYLRIYLDMTMIDIHMPPPIQMEPHPRFNAAVSWSDYSLKELEAIFSDPNFHAKRIKQVEGARRAIKQTKAITDD